MIQSPLPGWRVETIGDDIAWIRIGEDGRLWAINPEAGFFGVAPGTSPATNPVAVDMLRSDTIFTNTALTPDGDVWWEGLTPEPPQGLIDWRGEAWSPTGGKAAAHPNSRFTVAATNCETIAPEWSDPKGVPLSAILVGGRRPDTIPLVTESFDWAHGVFLGASMSSAQTAAAEGEIGRVRRDPFAMLPFCGYAMTEYWQHWLEVPKLAAAKTGKTPQVAEKSLPRVYQVNWFRSDIDGGFLWPGFSENMRVLAWVVNRVTGVADAVKSPLGSHPVVEDALFAESGVGQATLKSLFDVDVGAWSREAESIFKYFDQFGEQTPNEIVNQLQQLRLRLATNSGQQ